jgi:VMA21-like domain
MTGNAEHANHLGRGSPPSFVTCHPARCTPRLLHPQNREVGQKLGIATGLMFTLPFLAFYVALWALSGWENPESWAGAVAIVMTNVVVGGYCYVAYMEDRDINGAGVNPKRGASKERVD